MKDIRLSDGDELNIHALQDKSAIIEAMIIASTENCLMSASYNAPAVAASYDMLGGAMRLTKPDTQIRPENFINYYMSYLETDQLESLPARLDSYNLPMFTGRALFSSLLPEDFIYSKGDVTIENGILINGIITKDHVGSKGGSIPQALWYKYGMTRTTNFLSDLAWLIYNWMLSKVLSVGLSECYIPDPKLRKLKAEEEAKAKVKIEALGAIPDDPIEKENYEREVRAIVNNTKNVGERIVLEFLTPQPVLIISNIDPNVTKSMLEDLVKPYGDITSFKLEIDPDFRTKRAIISLGNIPAKINKQKLERAYAKYGRITHLVDGKEYLGTKKVDFNAEARTATIWLRSLPNIITADELTDSYNKYGKVNNVTLEIERTKIAMLTLNNVKNDIPISDLPKRYEVIKSQYLPNDKNQLIQLRVADTVLEKDIRDTYKQYNIGSLGLVNDDIYYNSRIAEIKFDSRDKAEKAVRELNGKVLLNTTRPLLVKVPPKPDSSLYDMAKSGEKGSAANIAQMTGMVGQQFYRGERIRPTLTHGTRTLPHFTEGDLSIESQGWIRSSFIEGLTPAELFFHQYAGREGLTDTSIKTAEVGYMHNRMVKAMEDFKVEYDGTVRNASGIIYQFQYGDDGFEGSELQVYKSRTGDHTSFIDIKGLIRETNNRYGFK